MQLYTGNKNYSSWSMRIGVLMLQAGIAFDEIALRYDSFETGSAFKRAAHAASPTGRVPVLVDGALTVWDSLAIAEYLAERFPEKALWPADRAARARARSVCAEMHAGFAAMRTHLTMNIEASLPEVGARVLREHAEVRAAVARIVEIWSELLEAHGGPLLFGDFTIADAYFAPVVMRFRTYGVPVPRAVGAYMARVVALPGVAAWIDAALREHAFVPFQEIYRLPARINV